MTNYTRNTAIINSNLKKGCKESGKIIKNIIFQKKVRVPAGASKISSLTHTATYLQKGNKVVNFPRKDNSKPVTEPNFS